MATSSAAASTSSSFSRLLKGSKVLSQYDPAIPLVYTSHGGSRKRSDFGLKRALPSIKSPAIRVQHLDSPRTKLTEFEYASREHQFVKRWRESGIGITGGDNGELSKADEAYSIQQVSEQPGASTWDRANFESVEKLKQIAKTGRRRGQQEQEAAQYTDSFEAGYQAQSQAKDSSAQSSSSSSTSSSSSSSSDTTPTSFPPNYADLSDAQFEEFLAKLKELRPKYKEYFMQKLDPEDRGLRQSLNAWYTRELQRAGSSETREATLERIHAFLAQEMGHSKHDPVLDVIKPAPHYSLGLSYAPPTLYQMDVASRNLPGRVLGKEDLSAMTRSRGIPTGVLGVTSYVKAKDLNEGSKHTTSTTHYFPQEGALKTEYGKVALRIESATLGVNAQEVRDSYARQAADSDPATEKKNKTILDERPLVLTAYAAPVDSLVQLRDPVKGIGTQAWVGRETHSNETSIGKMKTSELFRSSYNRDRFGNSLVSPPSPYTIGRPASIPRAKYEDHTAELRQRRRMNPDQQASVDRLIGSLAEMAKKS